MTNADIENAMDDCRSGLDASNNPFNEWEENFLFSILNQWDEKKWLSPKQQETLKKMWNKV